MIKEFKVWNTLIVYHQPRFDWSSHLKVMRGLHTKPQQNSIHVDGSGKKRSSKRGAQKKELKKIKKKSDENWISEKHGDIITTLFKLKRLILHENIKNTNNLLSAYLYLLISDIYIYICDSSIVYFLYVVRNLISVKWCLLHATCCSRQ